jgi:hypothetical protein
VTTQLHVRESVHEVRASADEKVKIAGPVLAVLEGAQPVEHESLGWQGARRVSALEQQAVTAEAFDLTLHGRVSDLEAAGDLAQAAALDQAAEDQGTGSTASRRATRAGRTRGWDRRAG